MSINIYIYIYIEKLLLHAEEYMTSNIKSVIEQDTTTKINKKMFIKYYIFSSFNY